MFEQFVIVHWEVFYKRNLGQFYSPSQQQQQQLQQRRRSPSPEFGTQSGSETEEYEDIQLSQGLKDEERRQSSRRKSRRLNANAPVNDSEERDSLAIADYHQGEGEGESTD